MEGFVLNERGGVINIIIAIIIIIFVLLALMNPIIQLTDVLDNQMANLQNTPRNSRDIDGNTITATSGGALGGLTMTLMYGLGFIFLIGLIIYIIRFGPNRPIEPPGGYA